MSEFEALLPPYDLDEALRADLEDGPDHCIKIAVVPRENQPNIPTLRINPGSRPATGVGKLLTTKDSPQSKSLLEATKLYVVGDPDFNSDPSSLPWMMALLGVCRIIENMPSLQELNWISPLGFNERVLKLLPKSIIKLIVDIGRHASVGLHNTKNESDKLFISQGYMKPLLDFTTLRELRIFGMRDSFQSLLWEVVFRNESEYGGIKGMHILDLQMHASATPLVRQDTWVQGKYVRTLTVPTGDVQDPQTYKGLDGKGILHHNYGTGEYLDDYCIRKARIASGLDEAKPIPLWCLKLDGFVVDQLPFEHELSRVVLVTFGAHCVDAGFRAPRTQREKTLNKWGASVDNPHTHCYVAWPNFAAVFNNDGKRLDDSGRVMPDSDSDYVQLPRPTATESLYLERSDVEAFLVDDASNASTRGSTVPSLASTPWVDGAEDDEYEFI